MNFFPPADPDIWTYSWLMQRHVNWLTKSGVSMTAIVQPHPVRLAHGRKAADGRFEPDPTGPDWFVFCEWEDLVFWRPRTGEVATWAGRAFALGESAIDNASGYALDGHLHVFADPLQWLRSGRGGIVVLDWARAFDELRHCPRIAVAESLWSTYRLAMRPVRMPRVFLRRGQ
ncbi:hypothetical protein IE4803_CH03786 [Rhizobium etli bv. phaseoli str. IE4803]|nr:hypothetical protein IE4803_CH03786 [Rhizobium etli bv. phaseoli str. IE4803]